MAAAPGRVNMIGEHVDYNSGLVLPMAINRFMIVAAARAVKDEITIVASSQQSETVSIPMSNPMESNKPSWANYVQGVMAGFQELGFDLPALRIGVHSNVPTGAGLSSSAALEVATATALEAILETSLDKKQKALLCQRAEHQFAGVPCGIMDQFISVFGQADNFLLLDCCDYSIKQVPFANEELAVLIIDSKVKHELASSEYALRQKQCKAAANALRVASLREVSPQRLKSKRNRLEPIEYRRAKHVITEIERTTRFVEALAAKDWTGAGELLYESHRSLRDDYEVSCTELDELVVLAQETGVEGGIYGSRLTGGGFGGCTVSLVEQDAIASVVERIASSLGRKWRQLEFFVTRPVQGAREIAMN